ncbi:hypothetical protein KAFR_0B04500 [Kazachstania africana CBS 2517]|uniref:Mitochondrial carrier protein n=1 Tax=Kazachstania africana (strain ATCC 22294 / BCRC 22015 / CBS 2517 / CECT 1963 / NBRC 1671 / NRRL Y-8276) TaxID=1071382 RepID=H2AQU7_KAZAF|nr:hypothetical protein KAFR_0B04500 [Kazachstania africana CBS 2517]CCF56747.1 hypothetical protein KAFR_0B04500 [Kazachstania africana CBS 2517]
MTRDDKTTLTAKERMLSASIGSLLTSLTLTPMDVVRIRLQQQEMLPDCLCETPVPDTIKPFATGKAPTNLTKVATSKLTFESRLSMTKEKAFWEGPCFQDLACKRNTLQFNSTLEAFKKISRVEGTSTLWRGISLNLLMAIPSNVVYFTGYEYLRDMSPLATNYSNLNPLICGAFARTLAATSVAPLELLKTRFQSIPRSSKSRNAWLLFKELMRDTAVEMKAQGPYKALFKGLEITLWRDVPFSAVYWGSYEFCKKTLWSKTQKAKKNSIHFANSFLTGCISGTIAAFITHPFDVGKTRWQISLLSNTGSRNRPQKSRNMFKFLNMIRQNEGIAALYTGLLPRVIKIAPSCAIMISSYELCKRLFVEF